LEQLAKLLERPRWQSTENTKAFGLQTWQSDSSAHWLTTASNRDLGRDGAAMQYDSRNLSDEGVVDDELFTVEMRMAARNLQIPGIRQWWNAGGRNQMSPRFTEALEAFDPGKGANWAWTKETGFVSSDEIESLSLDSQPEATT
jgi:hypothetical protein